MAKRNAKWRKRFAILKKIFFGDYIKPLTHTHAHTYTHVLSLSLSLSLSLPLSPPLSFSLSSRSLSLFERPEAKLPDRALYLPTFSHLLIVNKHLSFPPSLSDSPYGDRHIRWSDQETMHDHRLNILY